jgi:cysteine desulfurase
MGIDLLSLSGHKIYGPKGIGALYKRKDIQIEPLFHGGGHEKNIRSGTYNTPGIVGLGTAISLFNTRMKKDNMRIKKYRDELIKSITSIAETYLNGHPKERLVNNAHFRFTAIEGESLIMLLDDKGIMASTGSACSSANLKASHVLTSIGLKPEEAHGSLRLTLGRTNTQEDIDYIIDTLPNIIKTLRDMSPLWNER